MISQVALNSELSNHFSFFEYKDGTSSMNFNSQDFYSHFENGKVLVIEGLTPKNVDFFYNLPECILGDWVPPLYDNAIRKKYHRKHPLRSYYKDKKTIQLFQLKMEEFQSSWKEIHLKMFPHYDFVDMMWSWRMNTMNLGFLHLDIPESNFKEQQMRSFINLSLRPRVIEFGPTLQEIVAKFIDKHDLKRFFDLPSDKFIEAIKYEVLKKHNYEDLYLPRHYLTLAPGAMWICNAFMITHGLVFGEKTVCLEARLKPESMKKKNAYLHNVIEGIKHSIQDPSLGDFSLYV